MSARRFDRSVALGLALVLTGACRRRTEPPPHASRPDAARPVVAPDVAAVDAAPAPPTPSPAPTGDSCTFQLEPVETGRQAEVMSLSLFASQGVSPRYFVAWAVAPRFANGGDDVALTELEDNGAVLAALDREEPSTARGLARSPQVVFRAFARPTGNGYAADSDRLSRDDDGSDIVECGDLSEHMSTAEGTADDAAPRAPRPGAMFFCRTAYTAQQPFVLGMRGAAATQAIPDTVRFFATRATTVPSTASDFWPLPFPADLIRRVRNPAAAIREAAPEGLEVIPLPTVGYGVAFRFQHHLYLGALNESLQPVGTLAQVETLGGEPGRPRIASDGARIVLVFADRAAAVDAAPPKYALYVTSAPFGAAPAHPMLLSTGLPPDAPASDDFAPTVVAQADGSWVVAFTHGPHDPRDGETQQVYVRAYNPDLTPRGAPVLASDARGASDPRLLFTGDHHLLATAVGHGSHRAVVVRNVRCISRPVGEH